MLRPTLAFASSALLSTPSLRWLALVFLSLGVGCAQPAPSPFCALTVRVVREDCAEIKSTWLELVDDKGKVVVRTMMRGPIARTCDFGFGVHRLRVGTNECHPTEVGNIR